MESGTAKEDAIRQLREAIAALYTVFARYPEPTTMPTRWDEPLDADELARLRAKPLHSLQWEQLAEYAFKAMSLWGHADEYRYFLPRLLELLVDDPPEYHWGLNEALVLSNIHKVWPTWPEGEQQALEGYLAALWRYTLAAFDPGRREAFLQDAPCCIAQLIDDLTPYLAVWEEMGTHASVAYLARYVDVNGGALAQKAGLDNSYWGKRRVQEQQVLVWLLGPRLLTLLESAYFTYQDEPLAGDLAQASNSLFALRRASDSPTTP